MSVERIGEDAGRKCGMQVTGCKIQVVKKFSDSKSMQIQYNFREYFFINSLTLPSFFVIYA